ncbi:hypothetical protein [Flavobacterium sp.]|uniref:hypothetical protein n=1 Tax=Flavobacterium sp. TaxID=239 RepID=UPI0031D5A505
MAKKNNTGNYQVCRNQTGIAKSTEILKTGTKEEIDKFWNELIQEENFNYYKNEEVFYSGTQIDANGNPIDSTPAFQRM